MSSTRALNDEEVFAEMKKMVAFIKQEALEKAREIKVKADEEFNIEKAKIVRQESIHIESVFERKTKQVEIEKTIAKSTLTNKSRLEILGERQNLINELFETAAGELIKVAKDESKYSAFLKDLILQGFFQLMEPKVTLRFREKDEKLIEKAVKGASAEYEKEFGYPVEVVHDTTYLPEGCAGGIILSCLDGRIKATNTLESRLELLKEQMLPQIRYSLFGASPNRKFYD
ncbi:V-ATPase V1 sector subunit E [Entomophthora muscae]|uniref:V-ATPase V1 sector subunit E n=2 Tax=Entomophthora muscae TaxID=34485 RepID=A0ACC2UF57_9FUNG|nr:V-ATPase V1 sector subunit E [Entomophthora muscae]KAJ9085522.1 V-ATPase V1 sector subunit E [Entomophthora muscae]